MFGKGTARLLKLLGELEFRHTTWVLNSAKMKAATQSFRFSLRALRLRIPYLKLLRGILYFLCCTLDLVGRVVRICGIEKGSNLGRVHTAQAVGAPTGCRPRIIGGEGK